MGQWSTGLSSTGPRFTVARRVLRSPDLSRFSGEVPGGVGRGEGDLSLERKPPPKRLLLKAPQLYCPQGSCVPREGRCVAIQRFVAARVEAERFNAM